MEFAFTFLYLLSFLWTIKLWIKSTCCSIDKIIWLFTPGLWGPVIINKFGKLDTIIPKYVLGPSDHLDFKLISSSFKISIAFTAPVIASKPVANTKSSKEYSILLVNNPFSVIFSIGSLEISIRETLFLLYVSK